MKEKPLMLNTEESFNMEIPSPLRPVATPKNSPMKAKSPPGKKARNLRTDQAITPTQLWLSQSEESQGEQQQQQQEGGPVRHLGEGMIVPQNDDDTTGPVAPSMKLKLLQQTRTAMNTKDFHVEDNLGRDDMVFRIRPGVPYQLGIPIQRRKSGNEITLEIIGDEWENAPRYIVFEDNLPARVEDLNVHYSEQHLLW